MSQEICRTPTGFVVAEGACSRFPNAELLAPREDGTECTPEEPGEPLHRGALVGMGCWNEPCTVVLVRQKCE